MERSNPEAKELMKYSDEVKNKSGVMRYPLEAKSVLIKAFINIYSEFFNPISIRYIF